MNTNYTTFNKKIGNTTYTVKVCSSENAKETFEDKLIRLITDGYINLGSRTQAGRFQLEGAAS